MTNLRLPFITILTLVNIAILCARDCQRRRGRHVGEVAPPDTVRVVDTVYLRDTIRSTAYIPQPARILHDTLRIALDGRIHEGHIARVYYEDTYRDSNITIRVLDTVELNRIRHRRIEYQWQRPLSIHTRETVTQYLPAPTKIRPVVGIWALGNGTLGLDAGIDYRQYQASLLAGYGEGFVYGLRLAVKF